jgi:Superinfection immunity protein
MRPWAKEVLMDALAQSPVFWVGLIAGLALLYFLPTIIAMVRRVESPGWVIFLNVLPTGVGWLAAMVVAFMMPRREPPPAYVPYQGPPPGYSHPVYPYHQYPEIPGGSW